MTRKAPKKFVRPQQGDNHDKRCAFVQKFDDVHGVKHGKVTWRQWCTGCRYYICEKCSELSVLVEPHEVTAHAPDVEEDTTDVN